MKTTCLLAIILISIECSAQEKVVADSTERCAADNACCYDGELTLRKLCLKADEYFYEGNFEKALKLYERLVILKPGDAYAQRQVERMKIYVKEGF